MQRDTPEITMFSGDWHCAYVLLYGPRVLETDPEEDKMDTS